MSEIDSRRILMPLSEIGDSRRMLELRSLLAPGTLVLKPVETSEISDSKPMAQLQSVLEPTDEIQRLKATVQRCQAEIRRLDAEIQATLEVEHYDERLRQNNHSRPMRHKENAYSRALQTNTSFLFKGFWEEFEEKLGEQEFLISCSLWRRYKHKGSVINRYELVSIMKSPATAMELWELWDHIGMIKGKDSSSSQQLASARYLAREIREGTLGYQDGRPPRLKMQRSYEYLERPANRLGEKGELLEIVQPECVILSLAEINKPQTIRIGREWIKGPDGKRAYKKPFQLPENLLEQWLDQRVRKLYTEWEHKAYEDSLDNPDLRTGQRKNEDEDSNPLDSLDATSETMEPIPNYLDSLIAVETLDESVLEFMRLINAVAPKEQEFLFTLLQVRHADPDLDDKQAFAKTRQKLDISDAAGYQLLYRIRKIKKVC